tara:strand:- start:313 stop:474 length:162 start_codon:yes stop_codon:yes gene_type:complete
MCITERERKIFHQNLNFTKKLHFVGDFIFFQAIFTPPPAAGLFYEGLKMSTNG